MIEFKLQGIEGVLNRLEALSLTPVQRRRYHGWLGADIKRAFQQETRDVVKDSPVSLFDGSAQLRGRKARSFAAMIGAYHRADRAVVFDRDRLRQGHKASGRRVDVGSKAAAGSGATLSQARRLVELGATWPPRGGKRRAQSYWRRKLSRKQAGVVIGHLERSQGLGRERASRNLQKRRRGSVLPMVWRRREFEIRGKVDPAGLLQRFLRAQARGGRARR